MIILAPGALDKVFSAETTGTRSQPDNLDSRFRSWLKPSDAQNAPANPSSLANPYKNRMGRFE